MTEASCVSRTSQWHPLSGALWYISDSDVPVSGGADVGCMWVWVTFLSCYRTTPRFSKARSVLRVTE